MDGNVDLLALASMTLLAMVAGIADHPGVASIQIPEAVVEGKLAIAVDGHSMAGNHCCCCPVKAGYLPTATGRRTVGLVT